MTFVHFSRRGFPVLNKEDLCGKNGKFPGGNRLKTTKVPCYSPNVSKNARRIPVNSKVFNVTILFFLKMKKLPLVLFCSSKQEKSKVAFGSIFIAIYLFAIIMAKVNTVSTVECAT